MHRRLIKTNNNFCHSLHQCVFGLNIMCAIKILKSFWRPMSRQTPDIWFWFQRLESKRNHIYIEFAFPHWIKDAVTWSEPITTIFAAAFNALFGMNIMRCIKNLKNLLPFLASPLDRKQNYWSAYFVCD